VFLVADLPDHRFSAGSGWGVDVQRRLVLTNDHVVEQATRVGAYFPRHKEGNLVAERLAYLKDGRAIEGELIDSDPKCDLAQVRLSAIPDGATAPVLATQSPAVGDTIHSIGNPGAIDALWVSTHGTVRAVHRFRESDGVFEARVVETQSPVNAGDNGGPAVNDRGGLVTEEILVYSFTFN
jgi:S1-C subfamily serine protease